jgi:pyruvate-ferredoxin/flavodoxin oxidoreductase
MADNDIKFYTIDGVSIGREIGLGDASTPSCSPAFFKLANNIPAEDAIKYMKDAATASYGKRGEKVVAMNHAAIERGATDIVEVKIPASWKTATGAIEHPKATGDRKDLVDFVNDLLNPMNAQKGDDLPVSAFNGREDGTSRLVPPLIENAA